MALARPVFGVSVVSDVSVFVSAYRCQWNQTTRHGSPAAKSIGAVFGRTAGGTSLVRALRQQSPTVSCQGAKQQRQMYAIGLTALATGSSITVVPPTQ